MIVSEIKKKVFVVIIGIITTMLLLISFVYTYNIKVNAESKEGEPSFSVEMNATPNPVNVDQDITVSGNIIPNDFTINVPEKDVVLVLDVSNSMIDKIGNTDKTRLENMNESVLTFLDSVKNTPNMKISIIAYSSDAFVNPISSDGTVEIWKKSSSVNKTSLNYKCSDTIFFDANSQAEDLKNIVTTVVNNVEKVKIEEVDGKKKYMLSNKEIEGGTSTGEALRQAHRVLKTKNEVDSKNKSIVLMTDGIPGYYSDNNNNKNEKSFYMNIDQCTLRGYNKDKPPYLGGGGKVSDPNDLDDVKNATEYAEAIGKNIKKQNNDINMYTIGYGIDSQQEYIERIHKSIADNTKNLYFKSDDEGVKKAFTEIASKISTKQESSNLILNLNLPQNIESGNGTNEINLGENNIIKYTGQYINNNEQIKYTAEKIPFSFVIKGTSPGNYDLFGEENTSNIKFTIMGQEKTLKLPKISIAVGIPNIKAELNNENDYLNRTYKLGDVIPVSYTIKPQKFIYNEGICDNNQTYDPNAPKDIIFVIDTSSKMRDKLDAVQDALSNKIILNNNNDRFSIVTYDSEVKYKTLDDYQYLDAVKNMKNNGISNYTNAIVGMFQKIASEKKDGEKNINESNLLDALIKACDIFENGRKEKVTEVFDTERGKVRKNIIIIGANDVNLNEIKNHNNIVEKVKKYNPITLDLGDINSETKATNTNLKQLQYIFTGNDIADNETLEDEQNNNYFINIDYRKYNKDNPYNIFKDSNNFGGTSWIIEPISIRINEKLLGTPVIISTPKKSYMFKVKLKFDLNSNFEKVSNLGLLSNDKMDIVVTNEISIIYTLNKNNDESSNNKYEYEASDQVVKFTIKVLKSGRLEFGYMNNIVYEGIGNLPLENPLSTPIINVIDVKHGIYNGGTRINELDEKNSFCNKAIVPMAAKFDYTEQDKKIEINLNEGLKNYDKPIIYKITGDGSLSSLKTTSEFNLDGDKYICDEIKQPGKYIIVYNVSLDKKPDLNNVSLDKKPELFKSIFKINGNIEKPYTLRCNDSSLPDLF